ncbi:MAG: hypothetical protein NC305_06655 [Lachnospiraceae bacterium]|nr:hypothetical protein [Lachnospiraceae bacterium]
MLTILIESLTGIALTPFPFNGAVSGFENFGWIVMFLGGRTMFPVFSEAFVRMAFQAAKKYPEECKETRRDVDGQVRKAIREWSLQL